MLERVLIDIIGRDKASAAFDKAAMSAERSSKKIDGSLRTISKAGAAMSKTGATLTKHLTVPIVAVAAASVDTAMHFQKSMALLETAGGESARKVAVISKGIQKVAVDTGTSLDQLGEGMYTVAKAGAKRWSAVDQLKVLKAAAQGAKAENVDLGTATDALTSVMMSYGMKAGDAVKAENELIRGSGLAKTTMQQFAGSLSNVVPLAAALHISFAQVAGSLATMTQHGESPEQASQNLNNLLTNLAGQNNVASKAMQQLGVNTISLQKHLGKLGISGALDVVEKALEKNSKGGMVVVSAFKKAQLATGSLSTMLGTFTGKVKDNSEALLKGKMGYSDYYKYAKSLGGQVGASAQQFAAAYKSAYGFNDALRSGNGDVQTAATMLKKMLGGMTGMRAALMLTGTSAKQNARNIDEVGKAAHKAGADVLGWSKTSGTLSFKLSQAKANLQVLGVEIGTALIPVVGKLVTGISGVVTWFENLSPAAQHVVGVSALVVAALGPVLMVMGNIVRASVGLYKTGAFIATWGKTAVTGAANFVRGMRLAEVSVETMGTKSWGAGFKIGEAVRSMSTLGRTAVTALGGAGVGFAIGEMTKNASTATKVLGAFGAAGTGALMGFSMGGPVGAAIGGVTGALSDLLTVWGDEGDAAKNAATEAANALNAQNDAANNLLGALKAVNGQYAAQTREATINQLEKTGALKLAASAGINLSQLTNRVIAGNASQMVNALWNQGKISSDVYTKLSDAISNVEIGSGKAEAAFERFKAAEGQSLVPAKQLAGGLKNLHRELQNTGKELQYQVKSQVWNKGADHWTTGTKTINAFSAGAKRNTEVIRENVAALQDQAVKMAATGKGVQASLGWYAEHVSALKADLVQMGFNKRGVDALVDSISTMPRSRITDMRVKSDAARQQLAGLRRAISDVKQGKVPNVTADSRKGKAVIAELQHEIDRVKQGKTPDLTVDTKHGRALSAALQSVIDAITQHKIPGLTVNNGAGISAIAAVQSYLDSLHDKTVSVWVKTYNDSAGGGVTTLEQAGITRAAGGAVYGPGTKTSDSIRAWLSRGEHVWTADEVERAGGHGAIYRARAMVRAGALRFAKGGAVHHKSSSKSSSKPKPDTAAIGSAIGSIGSQYTKPIDVASVGIDRIERQIAHARDVLQEQIDKGLGDAAAAKFRKQIDRLAAQARKQLAQLKVKITHADVSALTRALHGTVTDTRSAVAQILADAKAAGISSSRLVSRIHAQEARIVAAQNKVSRIDARLGTAPTRSTAYDRLAAAQGNYRGEASAVKSAVLGGFDITSAGAGTQVYGDQAAAPATGSSILAALKVAVAKAKRFAGVLHKLAKMGLPSPLLSQLANVGPDALTQAQALASSGAGTIGSIKAEYLQLKGYGAAAGKTSADAMYGQGVKSAQKLVNGLLSQRKALQRAMGTLAHDMTGALDKALAAERHKQHTRKAAGGHHGHHGHDNGHDKQHHGHAHHGHHGHRPSINVERLEIHEQRDPVAAANAVTRRLAHLGAA